MSISAHDVAAAIRDRLPGVGIKKLHKLLYFCQGHHLAHFDRPLFVETVAAWDMGPVCLAVWQDENNRQVPPPRNNLGNAELNTIGYVISRYGSMSGDDLEVLHMGKAPWMTANATRRPGMTVNIRNAWMRDFFASERIDEDDGTPILDSEAIDAWLSGAQKRETHPDAPDDIHELRRRLAADA